MSARRRGGSNNSLPWSSSGPGCSSFLVRVREASSRWCVKVTRKGGDVLLWILTHNLTYVLCIAHLWTLFVNKFAEEKKVHKKTVRRSSPLMDQAILMKGNVCFCPTTDKSFRAARTARSAAWVSALWQRWLGAFPDVRAGPGYARKMGRRPPRAARHGIGSGKVEVLRICKSCVVCVLCFSRCNVSYLSTLALPCPRRNQCSEEGWTA